MDQTSLIIIIIVSALAGIGFGGWGMMYSRGMREGMREGMRLAWRMLGNQGDPLDEDKGPTIDQEDTE
jgi:hypothetical protein